MIDVSSITIDSLGPAVDSASIDNSKTIESRGMTLKSQLKIYLELFKMSPAQLSKKSGVSKQVISLWLGGGSPRKLDQLKAVADIFGVTVDHLAYGNGREKPTETTFQNLTEDEWMSGVFEIKIRRVKQK